MTPRCTVPSRNPCPREAETWIGVEGVPHLSCAVHRIALTREGAWVETNWTAPLDGPAPRFSGRPKSVEVIPDEPVPIPKRIGRPPGPRSVVSLTVKPEPKPRVLPTQITRVEVDDATPPGMCRNGWCPGRKGKAYRPAHSSGLCKSCRHAAGRLRCFDAVALPAPPKRGVGVEVDPSKPPHICRNKLCPGGGTRPVHSRGLCDTCTRAAQRAGVYDAVALKAARGIPRGAVARGMDHLPPLAPCRRCSAECRSERGYCRRCYDRAAQKAQHRGVRVSELSADVLHALTEITHPSCIRRKQRVSEGGEATNGN